MKEEEEQLPAKIEVMTEQQDIPNPKDASKDNQNSKDKQLNALFDLGFDFNFDFLNFKKSLKKEDILNMLYSPENYSLKVFVNQKCTLSELEAQSKRISVNITDYKFEKPKSLFFSQPKYSCTFSCPLLNTSVKRTFEDIEWLRNQFIERYPLTYIPPLININNIKSENENDIEKIITRYLEKFFNALIRKKILRTSPLTFEFLRLGEKEFIKYKKKIESKKFVLALTMENYKSNKENLEVNFKKEQLGLPGKYLKKIEPHKIIFSSLLQSINDLSNDFTSLTKHMKEVSDNFSDLYKISRSTEQSNYTKKSFEQLKNIFNSLSMSYEKQSKFFNVEFKEFFDYINMEIMEMENIQKQFMNFRNNYEIIGSELINKREKLFYEKKIEKWELTKEDEKNVEEFKNDHDKAVKYICKEFGELVRKQKTQVAVSCNLVWKEFGKLKKHIGEQMKGYLEGFKERNKDIIGNVDNIMNLLNIEIKE